MLGDVEGIRITPHVITFPDVKQGNEYAVVIRLLNINSTAKIIRLYGTNSTNFQLISQHNFDKPVPAGLAVTATLEFVCTENAPVEDRITVAIDGVGVEVPVSVVPSRPLLEHGRQVDFGRIVGNNKLVSKTIIMKNNGSEPGKFKFEYSGTHPIGISPEQGVLPPYSQITVRVELVAKQLGELFETVEVDIEDGPASSLTIRANVVDKCLEFHGLQDDEPLKCLQFGPAYYGTDRSECGVLYNKSPDPVEFIVMMDEDADGQEIGGDLSQTAMASMVASSGYTGNVNSLNSLFAVIPNQGRIGPYQKAPMFFVFSPRWHDSTKGFHTLKTNPPRKDFAVFLRLHAVGVKGNDDNAGVLTELALTATALPVDLCITPPSVDFGRCLLNSRSDTLCSLKNQSERLPLFYEIPKIAQFSVKPKRGVIKPGTEQEIVISFSPKQFGIFDVKQFVDIFGEVIDQNDPFLIHKKLITKIPIDVVGECPLNTAKPKPKFNPGISPAITHEVGQNVDSSFSSIDPNDPNMAVLKSREFRKHRSREGKRLCSDSKIAFPNDRYRSLRPTYRWDQYKTLFTRVDRYNYIDPDYAFSNQDMDNFRNHRQYYINFLRFLRMERLDKLEFREFLKTNNLLDIGMKPGSGIRPRKLKADGAGIPDPKPEETNIRWRAMTKKELEAGETVARDNFHDGLNATPITNREKYDCSQFLQPREIHEITVTPQEMDFGEVCVKSISSKGLSVINNLDKNIQIEVKVDCQELRQSSPLAQIVPPRSKAIVPLTFESTKLGRFERSIDYVINKKHRAHLMIVADVVPVHLELYPEELRITPSTYLSAEAGIRGMITLHNPRNFAANFQWEPILSKGVTAFSIRPALGVVDAFQDLECEVVFHASYLAPTHGEFLCKIHSGNTLHFMCFADIGKAKVRFMERRIVFGQVPLNLTTVRTAVLFNSGPSHAFFSVLQPEPFPGLQIAPAYGVIPVGGTCQLSLTLTPTQLIKFDAEIQVSVRGNKNLDLRAGGTVLAPTVDIDVKHFDFTSVHVGSFSKIPFTVTNETGAKTRIEFDLSKYPDFSIIFPAERLTTDDLKYQDYNEHCYCVTLKGNEVLACELKFQPTEIASYDFLLSAAINMTLAPTPGSTPAPPTPAVSVRNRIVDINHNQIELPLPTPRRRVLATALRRPLTIHPLSLSFKLPFGFFEETHHTRGGKSHLLRIANTSAHETVDWALDLSSQNLALEAGIFAVTHTNGVPFLTMGQETGVSGTLKPREAFELAVWFNPSSHGFFECDIPVILNDNFEHPFQLVHLTGHYESPEVTFDPLAIVFPAVPLNTTVKQVIHLKAKDYQEGDKLNVILPEIECQDGTTACPLKASFPQGNEIRKKQDDDGLDECHQIEVEIAFSTPKPCSFTTDLIFVDADSRQFKFPVTATADNCILTCYSFMAQHLNDYHVVCDDKKRLKADGTLGIPVLLPISDRSKSASQSRPSTAATESRFDPSTSFESSSVPSDSNDLAIRSGAINRAGDTAQSNRRETIQSRSLGSAVFPNEGTDEGFFHNDVLMATQRWFAQFGWPKGAYPIQIPLDFWHGVGKRAAAPSDTKDTWGASESVKNDHRRTIYEMVSHLCGKSVPGIPLDCSLPYSPADRVRQVLWQHNTFLVFLRSQGGLLGSVKPQYLLLPDDFQFWLRQQDAEGLLDASELFSVEKQNQQDGQDELYDAVSKKSWVDILLQILKCLVLGSLTEKSLKSVPVPKDSPPILEIDSDPLCSNVYSIGERVLLVWLNHFYDNYRERIWSESNRGGSPPTRWIVNFETDLLDCIVIGAAIGAYVPFLVESHLQRMYTHPSNAEQCLHNALIIISAMREIGLQYDIQAIDITDPNPVTMLLFCLFLFQRLPQYVPQGTIQFCGKLHKPVTRQIKVQNPSSEAIAYRVLIVGKNKDDFSVPSGDIVKVGKKGALKLTIEFVGRYMRSEEAMLLLIGTRSGRIQGKTLVFHVISSPEDFKSEGVLRIQAACYSMLPVKLSVRNPYTQTGSFRIKLTEQAASSPSNSQTLSSKTNSNPDVTLNQIQASNHLSQLSCFHSNQRDVVVEAGGTHVVTVNFLPFSLQRRICHVMFSNDVIGEFVYTIEASVDYPLPSSAFPTSRALRQSSARLLSKPTDQHASINSKLFWKCEIEEVLNESLRIPITNINKEHALRIAAQQFMSSKEIERRKITNTLNSSTLTVKAMEKLTGDSSEIQDTIKEGIRSGGFLFKVKTDSSLFTAPDSIVIPLPGRSSKVCEAPDGIVDLPIAFQSKEVGHFPCRIVLIGIDDIRVFEVEVAVLPKGAGDTLFEFKAAAHQAIIQEIPVVNPTVYDWRYEMSIEGKWFYGPDVLVAKANQTTIYPLYFKPKVEGSFLGQITMKNVTDNSTSVVKLKGTAGKPLPLDTLDIKCKAKEKVSLFVEVPNMTDRKLEFKAESNLPFVSGPASLVVLGQHSYTYEFKIMPMKRGFYEGAIAFTVTTDCHYEVDSDGEENQDLKQFNIDYENYQVWYVLNVTCEPPDMVKEIEIKCPCLQTTQVQIPVTNPTKRDLVLAVDVEGDCVLADEEVAVKAGEKVIFSLTYSPISIGFGAGSVVFFNEHCGEFWYRLVLVATPPEATALPLMECEIGTSSWQYITLNNPSHESLELHPSVSNTNNFILERHSMQPVVLPPLSQSQIPLKFTPSNIGREDHEAVISFFSHKLGEWKFTVTGNALPPAPKQNLIEISTEIGHCETLNIVFQNPFDFTVIADVFLTESDTDFESEIPSNELLPFMLLINQWRDITMTPKSTMNVFMSYCPTEMKEDYANCVITARKGDKSPWPHDDIEKLSWVYPIKGFPESQITSTPIVVDCTARERMEQRVELKISDRTKFVGVKVDSIQPRLPTPAGTKVEHPDGIVVSDGAALSDEYSWELQYDQNQDDKITQSVGLTMIRKEYEESTGISKLIMDIVFSPNVPFSQRALLVVRSAKGAAWKFPVSFISRHPLPDDVIEIESQELRKESTVEFTLYSDSEQAVSFTATLEQANDRNPAFSFEPCSGELLPQSEGGTSFKISFIQHQYGKKYQATLFIKTSSMLWSYYIVGTHGEYSPPKGRSSIPSSSPSLFARHRNFVKENINLNCTGISSTVQGKPVNKFRAKPGYKTGSGGIP